ncbi:MAG: hypothetical protein LAQ69_51750, partial [Acidobacteriia bacterium]|nr:hypothetical protein [Terriglobia bacterium]
MRRILISTSLLALSLAVLVAVRAADPVPPSKAKATKVVATAAVGYGNADSITEEEMKIYLYFLASDQLEGRNLPSRGYDTAALFVASHLAEWGLKPGGSATNTNGPLQPYFMPIELVSKTVIPEETKASITAPAGRGGRGGAGAAGGGGGGGARGGANAAASPTELVYAKDWTVSAGGRGAPPLEPFEAAGNLVFAGNGYVINKTKLNPYEGLDVRGKIIVVAGLPPELAALQAAGGRGARGRGGAAPAGAGTPPAPGGAAQNSAEPGGQPAAPAAGGGGRGAAPNPLGETCKDFLTPEQFVAKNGAVAVVTIANFQQL